MQVQLNARRYETVVTYKEASRVVREFIGTRGVSQCPRGMGLITDADKVIAHVSYNGRVWAANSVRGPYRNVAVVEVEAGAEPKMISTRARGVRRIVRHYGPQSVGKTDRCAYRRTLAEAAELVVKLNAEARR